MWAELFGTGVLGTIRSAVTMYMVVASALAPFVFGALLDAGWAISGVLAVFVAVERRADRPAGLRRAAGLRLRRPLTR